VINPASTMTGRKLTLFLAGLMTLVGPGCAGFMDKVTSKDFEFGSLFVQTNPLVVLRDSTDGRARAEALRSLREPKQHGGTDQDQDLVVEVLTKAAWNEHYVFCRLAAINTLRQFKDPRAVEGLKEAYYRATSFPPDVATVIKCQALSALGDTSQPAAVELLVKVLREPPVEGSETEKQQKMDERVAAARALGHFKHYEATEALVNVLKSEKDVALCDRVNESLQSATGKNFPPDYQVWADYLHQTGPRDTAVVENKGPKKFLEIILTGGK
jgi:hypothetical protein